MPRPTLPRALGALAPALLYSMCCRSDPPGSLRACCASAATRSQAGRQQLQLPGPRSGPGRALGPAPTAWPSPPRPTRWTHGARAWAAAGEAVLHWFSPKGPACPASAARGGRSALRPLLARGPTPMCSSRRRPSAGRRRPSSDRCRRRRCCACRWPAAARCRPLRRRLTPPTMRRRAAGRRRARREGSPFTPLAVMGRRRVATRAIGGHGPLMSGSTRRSSREGPVGSQAAVPRRRRARTAAMARPQRTSGRQRWGKAARSCTPPAACTSQETAPGGACRRPPCRVQPRTPTSARAHIPPPRATTPVPRPT